MYNPASLRAAFSGVVGILQSNLPQVPQINSPLIDSSSGIYVQDKHPLVSLENIWYAAPDFNANNYAAWVNGNAYAKGVATNDGGKLYQAINTLNPSTVAPHLDATNWVLFNPFQSYVQQKFNQAVTNLFSEVVKIFKLQDKSRAILERQQLYRGGGSKNSTVVGDDSFVGFEMLIQQAEALLVQIDAIGCQFTEAQDLEFYLYHTSKFDAPVTSQSIAVGGSSSFTWNDVVNFIMMYLNENTQGTYIIGYYQSDLTPGNQAITKDWDCSQVPCTSCDGSDLMMYNRWSRYTAFRNIKIPASGLDIVNKTLPDLSKCQYGYISNWGMNFSLTVRCDLTDFIIYSKTLYADALAMQLALEFLKTIALSTRIDPAQAQIKNQARAELNLTEKSTFINQYWNTVRALKADMSGFSTSCQPSDGGKSGKKITWGSI